MTSSFRTAATLAVLAAAPLAAAVPVSITTADGALGADNQIQGKSFGDRELINKGVSTSIELRSNGNPANNFVGVLRFDLGAVTGAVDFASLTITTSSVATQANGISVFALNEASALGGPDGSGDPELSEVAYTEGISGFSVTPMDPSDLNGDIAPGFDELANGVAMVSGTSTLVETAAIAAGTAANTEVTFSGSALVDAINNDTNGALVLYLFNSNSSENVAFFTGDFSANPGPVLSVNVVPEPASAAALAAGSLALLRRRRSR